MESHRRSRVLIADDHKLVAELCKNLLEADFEVVAVVSDGMELIQATNELRPDVVILDVAMPNLNGLLAAQQIREKQRATKLIFLTMNANAEVAAEAFRRGASGYVLKQCSADDLIIAVRRVLCGESYLSPLITKATVDFLLQSGTAFEEEKRLTARQQEILYLLAQGKPMKEIAYMLSVRPATVAFHKYRIMEILGVTSSAELIQYAIKKGISGVD